MGDPVLSPRRVNRPDVVIIAMDCARATSLTPWGGAGADTPFMSELGRHSVTYTRCTTAATWTVPAHASLFTGVYPWRHGTWGANPVPLDRAFPTLAECLGESGYRTISLSANPFISPRLRLTAGFEAAFWGDWASHYLRFLSSRIPLRGATGLHRTGAPASVVTTPLLRLSSELVNAAHAGWPPSWKVVLKLANKLNPSRMADRSPSSPWIEPALENLLKATRPTVPVFCFINLLDAHEPYLFPSAVAPYRACGASLEVGLLDGLDRWTREWEPSSAPALELRRRYHEALGVIDQRVRAVLAIFERHRSSARRLIVLTSDHGQTFGEGGNLFHAAGTSDELLHVPLLVRYPDDEGGGTAVHEWVSISDVMPTTLHEAGLRRPAVADGESLLDIGRSGRRRPVLTMVDGKSWGKAPQLSGGLSRHLPQGRAAVGFYGNVRAVVSLPAGSHKALYTPVSGPALSDGEVAEAAGRLDSEFAEISRRVGVAGDRGSHQLSVSKRLDGWGY